MGIVGTRRGQDEHRESHALEQLESVLRAGGLALAISIVTAMREKHAAPALLVPQAFSNRASTIPLSIEP